MTLSCDEIVFRLALNARSVAPYSADAFLLRKSDNGKLSVFRTSETSYNDCAKKFNKPKGAFTLHSGRVRTVPSRGGFLEIVEDAAEEAPCPGHAAILNLPDPQVDAEALEAERVASLLREQSRFIS